MGLATKCPQCHTTFRVAHDQLKLRAGMVRCGVCNHIFNGIEHLAQPESSGEAGGLPQAEPNRKIEKGFPKGEAASTTAGTPLQAATPAPTQAADLENQSIQDNVAAQTNDAVNLLPIPPSTLTVALDSRATIDAMEHGVVQHTSGDAQPKPDPGIKDLAKKGLAADQQADSTDQNQPAITRSAKRMELAPDDSATPVVAPDHPVLPDTLEEPGFVKRARHQQRIRRASRIFFGLFTFVLSVAMVFQATYTFRNLIAAWYPQTKAWLDEGCKFADCQVGLAAQIDNLTIEPNERALLILPNSKNLFELTVLLRNHSTISQMWPHIELALNDSNGKIILRRVFKANEFALSEQELARGIAPNSEQPLKIFFELSQLKASGYAVQAFYP